MKNVFDKLLNVSEVGRPTTYVLLIREICQYFESN